MSIATLKKKTGYLYNSQSVGYKNFSLNGTHRSQGWVGQTMLSRSLPRTLARGNAIRGSGGLYGSYNTMRGHSITSGLVDFNNNKIIKPSVINSLEMIEIRNKCLRRFRCSQKGKGFNIVKNNGGTQDDHITHVAKCSLSKYESIKKQVKIKKCATLNSKYLTPQYDNIFTNKMLCGVTKTTDTNVLIESIYVDNLSSSCVKNIDNNSPENKSLGYRRGPLPGN